MSFDAIIVGAGPAGSMAAKAIAEEGYDVLVLEEHLQVGLPQHCAGKISVNASRELNLPSVGILQEVRGATFHSPDMNSLSVERKDAQAHIFDRAVLDRWLSEKAVDAGAKLITGACVVDASINLNGTNVWFKHEGEVHRLTTRIIVGADGAVSSTARHLGLYLKERSAVRVAVQREMTNLRDVSSEFVEVYLGRRYAPGFFAWIVPTGKDSARVGLAVDPSQSKDLLNYLDSFINFHPIARRKLDGGLCVRQTAHIIPTGGASRQTVSDGVLIVGDAAGQVKSTSGGGLYYGMVCAQIAGQVVSKALSSATTVLRRDALVEYQNLWQERFGREIEVSAKTRLLLDSLTDEELSYLFNLLQRDEALVDFIEAEGDIDWQFKLSAPVVNHLMSALVRRPKLLLKLGKFIALLTR